MALRQRDEDEEPCRDIPKLHPHTMVILSGLSGIIQVSNLLPLELVNVRLHYPDTWYVSLLRQVVRSRYKFPNRDLRATTRRSIYTTLKFSTYYCLWDSHVRNCTRKGLSTLSCGEFLCTNNRPIILNIPECGSSPEIQNYEDAKWQARKHNVFKGIIQNFMDNLYRTVSNAYGSAAERWPIPCTLGLWIVATTLLHPLDVMKVRLQLYPESWGISLFSQMIRGEGIRAPYTGLSAGILRQATYTTSKLGTYYCLYEYHKSTYGKVPSFSEKIAIGVYAGLVGAIVGCPAEIVLVRMMADGPVDPYRRYKGLSHAFSRIWQEEGFSTLWRGALLTMSRSVVISVAQIGTYAVAHEYLTEKHNTRGFLLHLYTSMVTSLVTAVATLPLDTFKTRYQVASCRSYLDTYWKFRQETGLSSFWRGFTPYYVRLTIHTLITFYLLEILYDLHTKTKKKSSVL